MFPVIEPPERYLRQLQRELKRERAGVRRALARGLNRTLVTARELGKDLVTEKLNIKAGGLKKQIAIRRATSSSLRGRLRMARKSTPIGAYKGTRATRKGVSAKPYKDRPRFVVEGAFKATMPSGHTGFWRNVDWPYQLSFGRDKKGRQRRGRLPLREVFGPNAAEVFFKQLPKLDRRIQPILERRLEAELDYFRSQQTGGRRAGK